MKEKREVNHNKVDLEKMGLSVHDLTRLEHLLLKCIQGTKLRIEPSLIKTELKDGRELVSIDLGKRNGGKLISRLIKPLLNWCLAVSESHTRQAVEEALRSASEELGKTLITPLGTNDFDKGYETGLRKAHDILDNRIKQAEEGEKL